MTALEEVAAERARQDVKWGQQNHPDGTGPEVAEAFAESDEEKLRTKLIQVAAVATQWVEAIDRRNAMPEPPC